ncbi:MAG: TolC family protein [Polyangiaceae bacterium]|nr:TolC family protein [Polyangiaceae bacterium]
MLQRRFIALAWLASAAGVTNIARAEPRILDRAAVVALASAQAPSVAVAERRVEEARAARTGAGVLAPINPELSVYVGPRWQQSGTTSADYYVGLAWPFDLSGAPSRRMRVADEGARLAESEAEATRQTAIAEALVLWASARAAEERVRLDDARLTIDRSVLRSAEIRRRAGTAGDGNLALARALEAQGAARLVTSEHEAAAFEERLRARVGLRPTDRTRAGGSLITEEPKPLEALLRELAAQPAIVRALAQKRFAESDAALQRRAGWPVPRIAASMGRDPDTYAHLGVDVPLPIYQRNQTNAAVAAARRETAETEVRSALVLGEAELRAAYTEYEGAREAFKTLDRTTADIDDAEHLAVRSYELGQTSLSELATTRREAAAARIARLDASIALAKARIALDLLTGSLR